jgi:hypothetical protein
MRNAATEKRLRRPLDAVLVERIRTLIAKHPTFGYRKLWPPPRYADGFVVNLKAVHRIFAGCVEARATIASWIRWCNERRPHQALGHLNPQRDRAQELQAVA